MRNPYAIFSLLFAAIVTLGCGSDSDSDTPTEPTPVAVTETFSGTLTRNGLQVQVYMVNRAGTTSAQITAMSDATAVVGLSLGTWNGAACQVVIANPSAGLNTAVTGTAQNTGQFCVLLNDVGKLTDTVDYTLAVTHF